VCFHARDSAEKAIEVLFDRFFISNKRLKILWAKAQLENPGSGTAKEKRKSKGKIAEEKAEKEKADLEEEKQQPITSFSYEVNADAVNNEIAKERLNKVAITKNEQLKKLMFNFGDDDEGDKNVVQYPSMQPNRNGGLKQETKS
jgi:hypothetical protein